MCSNTSLMCRWRNVRGRLAPWYLGITVVSVLALSEMPAWAQLKLNEFMAASTAFTSTSDYPVPTVGLSINSPEAMPGYTLLDPMHGKTTYLIDNTGQIVHTWTSAYEPGRTAYLMPNGHLFRACMAPGEMNTGGGEGGRIEERDWDGNLVWYLDYTSSTYMMHHDFKVLPNGNIIMLVVEKMLYADVIAAGFNPSLLDPAISTDGFMLPDSVVEVQPSGSSGGTVVWEWHVRDHLIQDYSSSKANYGVVALHPELVDANGPGIQIPQFWNHFNGIDYNPALDQVMLSARNQNEVWIIDHSTTTAQAAGHSGGTHNRGGDLLYRWGDPRMYDAGTIANRMLYEQHNTQWIASDSPGAGNILFFNNGINRPAGTYSTIDEFTPPVDAAGNYAYTPGSAYGPAALTWTFIGNPPTSFYSMEISGAQRLQNGNTLICEGLTGRIFEVTTAGEIVWQYQCPETNTLILNQGASLPEDPRGGYMTAVFRALRYPTSYGAFSGRTLVPSGTVERYPDWIEVRNLGSSAVDMGGMYLTNDAGAPTKWQIPTGVSIPAGGYLMFWADNQAASGGRHTSFTLDPSGGSIALFAADGVTQLDSLAYGPQATNVSYGRYPNGSGPWGTMVLPTPGAANIGSGGLAPSIVATTQIPASPLASDNVGVTATITDDGSVSNATLTYSTGSGTPTSTTVFTESMCSTAVKPWIGTGAVNAWTVTGNYFEQRIGANYGTGNACGMEYKGGTTLNPLTSAMAATTNAINTVGTSGYIEFWIQSLTLDGTDGWTFQLDSGSGFVTRLSELTGSSHSWQKYHYDLASGELVSALKMRFQFTGGGAADDDRIDLDLITVTVASGTMSSAAVTIYDDGFHGDGAAGDHVYGGLIPAMATGTTVSYYLTAADDVGYTAADPSSAPVTVYSYTVGQSAPPPVADGKLAGAAAHFSKSGSVSGQIDVTYGTAPCSTSKAVIVYGTIGDYSGYQGCAQPNAGSGGMSTLAAGDLGDVWFNILWTSGSTAGHPGYGFSGVVDTERAWGAAGFCGIAADDHTDNICD